MPCQVGLKLNLPLSQPKVPASGQGNSCRLEVRGRQAQLKNTTNATAPCIMRKVCTIAEPISAQAPKGATPLQVRWAKPCIWQQQLGCVISVMWVLCAKRHTSATSCGPQHSFAWSSRDEVTNVTEITVTRCTSDSTIELFALLSGRTCQPACCPLGKGLDV